MKVTLKLFATLGVHLPPAARREGQAEVEAPDGTTVADMIGLQRLPLHLCALVLVNGRFVGPRELGDQVLQDGDVLAIWPPVGGG
ncbi:MAG: MoaD/ThiS family protein [Holophaga sp.]|jgi:sulfur carrier protein ThiS